MRSIVYAMIAALAVSGTAVAVTDSGDHYGTTPYCNTTQKDSLSDRTTGTPLVRACEGEHWEGGDYNTAKGTGYGGCQAATTTSSGWLVSHNYCPGSSLSDNSNGIGDVGARNSGFVTTSSTAVYTGIHIGGVGKTSTWVEITGGKVHVVWFGMDNTDQAGLVTCLAFADEDCNALASVIHDVGITKGSAVKEESPDCSQNDPNNASNNYEKGTCARDNTSIGLVLG